MKESKVLVIGDSNSVTELARHLVLSGINIELFTIPTKVGSSDFSHDFLFEPNDQGKDKGEVIVAKLQEMNPFCKIQSAHFDSID